MEIEELIKEARTTNDEKLINQIIKHYEPYFCNNVEKTYGKGFIKKAKEVLLGLVQYYFENDLKDKLNSFLRKRALTTFKEKYSNFNEMINSDKKEKLKEHYINKMYVDLKNKCGTRVLSDKELYELSSAIIGNIYSNYLGSEKNSNVSNYFNIMINRKINLFQNEEQLLLSYIQNIRLTEKIINYFYSKYIFMLKEFDVTSEEYKKILVEILKTSRTLHTDVKSKLRKVLKKQKQDIEKDYKQKSKEEIEKVKKGENADIDLIKDYCSYVKDIVFNKFKDIVCVDKYILKEEIDKKYEIYFKAGIKYIYKNHDIFLSNYINSRLTDHINKKKIFFEPFYVDEEENVRLANKYAVKYAGTCPREILFQNLISKYNSLTKEYYLKPRKANFDVYIKNGLRLEAKKLNASYSDDSSEDFKKSASISYKKTPNNN